MDSKREMDVLSALDELRSLNARKQKLSFDQVLSALKKSEKEEEEKETKKRLLSEELDPDDEEAIRTLFYQQRAKLQKTDQPESDKESSANAKLPKPSLPEAKPSSKGSSKAKERKKGLFGTSLKIRVKKKKDDG